MQKHSPIDAAEALPRVLIVEDDRAALMALEHRVEGLGYAVETAMNGAEAFAMLREDPERCDVVLTDRMMPVMDGLALTRRLKRHAETRDIPVVLLTGATEAEDISAGIEAGAFYYLGKPPVPGLITSVLSSAMQEVKRRRLLNSRVGSMQAGFANLEVMRFKLNKPHEIEPVVSMLASMLDDPDRGIQALFELVQNGIEHGVLRFGLENKAALLGQGNWQRALSQRANDPAYAEGMVEATGLRKPDGVYFTIKDTGPGFVWKRFMQVDPARSSMPCGRGITRVVGTPNCTVQFGERGNAVALHFVQQERLKW